MQILGLTGGIASGKSTVARMFAELGATVLSADLDARAVLEPASPTLTAVLNAFPEVRNTDGTVNRAALAARIFSDTDARKQLESLMHPAIFARMKEATDRARSSPTPGVMIYEVPLLFESRRESLFDGIVAVLANPAVQAERLQERERKAGRPPLTEEQITERLAAQMPPEEKARRADYVIHTDIPLEQTREQVIALWNRVSSPPEQAA